MDKLSAKIWWSIRFVILGGLGFAAAVAQTSVPAGGSLGWNVSNRATGNLLEGVSVDGLSGQF
jgi:hypothetical protein